MARESDPHPEPINPTDNPAPKFPPCAGGARNVTPPRPGVVTPSTDNPAPARQPFPDHPPDPGVSRH